MLSSSPSNNNLCGGRKDKFSSKDILDERSQTNRGRYTVVKATGVLALSSQKADYMRKHRIEWLKIQSLQMEDCDVFLICAASLILRVNNSKYLL